MCSTASRFGVDCWKVAFVCTIYVSIPAVGIVRLLQSAGAMGVDRRVASASDGGLGTIAVVILCVLLGAAGCFTELAHGFTNLGQQGIGRLTLRGRRFIPWQEVTRVQRVLHAIEIEADGAKLKIVPHGYDGRAERGAVRKARIRPEALDQSSAASGLFD